MLADIAHGSTGSARLTPVHFPIVESAGTTVAQAKTTGPTLTRNYPITPSTSSALGHSVSYEIQDRVFPEEECRARVRLARERYDPNGGNRNSAPLPPSSRAPLEIAAGMTLTCGSHPSLANKLDHWMESEEARRSFLCRLWSPTD